MFEGLGQGLEALYHVVKWTLIITVPLAIWKIIDVIVWLFNHIDVSIV